MLGLICSQAYMVLNTVLKKEIKDTLQAGSRQMSMFLRGYMSGSDISGGGGQGFDTFPKKVAID